MKRVKQLILLVVCIMLLSGCVKERINMSIGKDKSLNLTYDVLLSDKLSELSDESEDTDMTDDVAELEKKGYTITPKTENGYSGYTISKKYDNIDKLSNATGTGAANLSDFLSEEGDITKTFHVKKGFLKNIYTAKFEFEFDYADSDEATEEETTDATEGLNIDTTESSMVPTTEQALTTTEQELTTVGENEEATITEETESTGDLEGLETLTALAAEMEFTYEVNLPYKAISSNAQKTSNNNKTLSWNMASEGATNIEFSFPIYNLTSLIIIGAVALVVIIIIIVVIVAISKKKKGSKETLIHTDYDSSIVNQINDNNVNPNEMQQGPTNHEFTVAENAQPQVNGPAPVSTEMPQANETTPTMAAPVNTEIPQENKFITPQETVNPMQNVQQPQGVNEVQLDVPNMTPINDVNQNNINQ